MGMGQTQKIGSPADTVMLNQGQYGDYMNQLSQAMSGFGGNLANNSTSAMNMYGKVADTAGNYDNFLKQMMGGGGVFDTLKNSTQGFDPTSALNQFMSQNKALASNADNALSGMYSSGREYASAAGADARRQAANELSAAGLLSSGGGVGAMTEATATPILGMEQQLAQTRANYLSGLNQSALGSLTSGYGANLGLAGQAANLGLGAMQGGTQTLSSAGQGMGNMASLYGGLYGQGLGYGAQMSEPVYWSPQYMQTPSPMEQAGQFLSFAKLFA